MPSAAIPFFLDAGGLSGGQRFCLLHPPAGDAALGAVVYVHPFAEEMNKSRRMAALQARALARAGHAVLQMDLCGCGDSSGDFGDATWESWIADVHAATDWLGDRYDAPLTLWGLRAGCLVASEAARRASLACDLLFWQPTFAGKSALQQFLRLSLAKDMMDGQSAGSTGKLRERLSEGDTLTIAGYALNPELAAGLERAVLDPPPRGRATWIEVSPRDEPALLPATAAALARWKSNGAAVSAWAVGGPAFWSGTEIEEAPALIAATLGALAPAPADTVLAHCTS